MSSKLERALIGHDDLENNPQIAELELVDVLLHVAGLAWCARWGTDGLISSPGQLKLVMRRHPDPEAGAVRLSASGIWDAVGSGWQLPWDGQITAARAARIQEGNKQRWDKYRETEDRCRAADHSQCGDRRTCPKNRRTNATNGVQNGGFNGRSDGVVNARLFEPHLPGPDRTDPQGIGEGGSGKRRSGARLVGAAALTPPVSDLGDQRDPDQMDHQKLFQALLAAHVDNPSPLSTSQTTQLRKLLPARSVTGEDVIEVLRCVLGFAGRELVHIDAGIGDAILGAGERLGAAGFPARWADAAAGIRGLREAERRDGTMHVVPRP